MKSSIGIVGLLGIAFVILKLCGEINWPWLWVTCPFWISAALWLVLVILYIMLSISEITVKRRNYSKF